MPVLPLALPRCQPRLVVVGDDAAAGHGADGYNGWAAQLGTLLNQQYGAALSLILLHVLLSLIPSTEDCPTKDMASKICLKLD